MKSGDIDLNYLRPPASALSITHTDYYKKHGETKKGVRKIFHDVEYDEFEKENLAKFEEVIKGEKLVFPDWWARADTLRFLYSQKFDFPKALKVLKAHLEWRADLTNQSLDEESKRFLESGVFYQSGRDKGLRPIVIINVHKIDLKTATLEVFMKALCYLLTNIETYMFLPGKIENWMILIETNSVGLFNFPFRILKKIIDVTSANYTSRLEKLYILNPSFSLNASWNLIQGMLDPETAGKIGFLKKSAFKEMLNLVNNDQLEEKYGGTRPNLIEFWPPKTTLEEPPYIPPNLLKKQIESISVSPNKASIPLANITNIQYTQVNTNLEQSDTKQKQISFKEGQISSIKSQNKDAGSLGPVAEVPTKKQANYGFVPSKRGVFAVNNEIDIKNSSLTKPQQQLKPEIKNASPYSLNNGSPASDAVDNKYDRTPTAIFGFVGNRQVTSTEKFKSLDDERLAALNGTPEKIQLSLNGVSQSNGYDHNKPKIEKAKFHAAYNSEEDQRQSVNQDNFVTFQNQVDERKSPNKTFEFDMKYEDGNHGIKPSGFCGFCKSREQVEYEKKSNSNQGKPVCNIF